MLRLQLDEEEKNLLMQVLESSIEDLRMEIADTDNYEYKLMLKSRKAVLQKVMEAIQLTTPMPIAQ